MPSKFIEIFFVLFEDTNKVINWRTFFAASTVEARKATIIGPGNINTAGKIS